MNPPLSYRILKQYVRFGLRIYFRQWENVHTENIPSEGPVIFVGNHQNSFLDALLVVCGIKRNPWFLARGDVFNKDRATRWLTFLQIKPVFRFRDGHSAMRKNDRIINECIQLLRQGECLLLFGEGTHNDPWAFSPLQRGFAQIALQYTGLHNSDLSVIPVAYHYELHEAFRSRVLVQYGEPISVRAITGNADDLRDKVNTLRANVEEKLRDMVLVIPKDENYPAKREFLKHNRNLKKSMAEQLQADREVIHSWKKTDTGIGKNRRNPYQWFDPLFLYGRIANGIPHLIMSYILKNLITDNQFIGSVKLAAGIFLVPLYYLLASLLFFAITSDPLWTACFFLSLPLSGLYAYDRA
jgi:1-acyl-sn-glycerol-3-phosphate acyltransferase